ncbi:MAG TPA: chromosome partitioning protein ParB [Flavobacteriales bacterium]|nr:chromosome partitioning protein ParB [Flavobacteriales bacterium]
MASPKKSALGRGLSALLEHTETDITGASIQGERESAVLGSIANIGLESIEANPFQPRARFENAALDELAESIRQHGIIQPVTVRKMGNGTFQLISGERRFRASQLAGLTEIPAYVRLANDQTMLEMALVENIQREDLNPIEVAISYKRLIDECDLTHEGLSEKLSKSRSNITNFLRLLKLPAEIQMALQKGNISMGHARALIGVDDHQKQLEIFERIINEVLSVRDVENLARKAKKVNLDPSIVESQKQFYNTARQNLAHNLNAKVDLKFLPKGNGKISIEFTNEHDLNRLIALLQNPNQNYSY